MRKAELLVALARTGQVQGDLEASFIDAAERLSAHEADRALAMLLRAQRR